MSEWDEMCDWLGVPNDEDAADAVINLDRNSGSTQKRSGFFMDRAPRKNSFKTYQEAISWAKENPGKKIKRSPDGNSFIES